MRNPVAALRGSPTRPRRPNANSNAAPPTTGGNTIGSVTTARTMLRPGNSTRAKSQASGTPNINEMIPASNEVNSDSRNASTTTSEDTNSGSLRHGVRLASPNNGMMNTAAPMPPRVTSTSGGRWPTRCRRAALMEP